MIYVRIIVCLAYNIASIRQRYTSLACIQYIVQMCSYFGRGVARRGTWVHAPRHRRSIFVTAPLVSIFCA